MSGLMTNVRNYDNLWPEVKTKAGTKIDLDRIKIDLDEYQGI